MPEIAYQGRKIAYEIERKRVKRVNLRITPDGQVRISAPRQVSRAFLQAFIEEKAAWVAERLDARAAAARTRRGAPQAETGGTIWLLGAPYTLWVADGAPGLETDGARCVLHVGRAEGPEGADRALTRQLRALYGTVCAQRLPVVLARFTAYALPQPAIRLRRMKRCWGTCQTKTAVITMNPALVHAPLCCTDYILAHELTHLIHPDHSAAFYRTMETAYPDWRAHKALLTEQHLL